MACVGTKWLVACVTRVFEPATKFEDMFAYDEFAHEKILVQCPDWEKPATFKPRPICDEDDTWLAMSLEKHGLTLDMGKIKKRRGHYRPAQR